MRVRGYRFIDVRRKLSDVVELIREITEDACDPAIGGNVTNKSVAKHK